MATTEILVKSLKRSWIPDATSECVCVSKCVCDCSLSQWSRCWVLSLQMTLEDFPTRCGMAYSPPRFQNKGLKIKSVLSLSSVKTIKTSVMQLWISQVQDSEGLSVCVEVQCSFAKYLHLKKFEFKHASSLKEEFTQILPPFFIYSSCKEWSLTSWVANPMILRCPMTTDYIFIYFTSMCCRCIILHYYHFLK